ncbi:MAG TPA: hypothetical protein VN843_02915, partial [Anaerolineales bacterium]|nr:hypothetical protein [Anaerolineales bacterium]
MHSYNHRVTEDTEVAQRRVLFSIESLLKCRGSNLDFHSKGRTIEKPEICLPGIVSDPFNVSGSRVA